MLGIIGCCGSSGSTFLRQQLDRHPQIAATGNELNMFSKPLLYDHYGRVRRWWNFVKRWGIPSKPYVLDQSVMTNTDYFDLDSATIRKWVNDSRSIQDLAGKFQDHIRSLTGKSLWIEKTPNNIFCVGRYLESFPDGRFIHIVRDPRDVVLSLLRRKHSVEQAADRWLAAVAVMQPFREHPRVLEVSYEDLITERATVLSRICAFLDLSYDDADFDGSEHISVGLKRPAHFDTWHADPSAAPSPKGIGKYKSTTVDLSALRTLRLTRHFARALTVPQFSLPELARSYGYDVPDPEVTDKRDEAVETHRPLLRTTARCLVETAIAPRLLDRRRYYNRSERH